MQKCPISIDIEVLIGIYRIFTGQANNTKSNKGQLNVAPYVYREKI
jgi:hypothetical protein